MVYVRKHLPDGRSSVQGFRSADLSAGGLYLVCEDLTLFDLGEEVELMVDADGRYHVTDARVVRSARTRGDGGGCEQRPSGFGLRFSDPAPALRAMVRHRIDAP